MSRSASVLPAASIAAFVANGLRLRRRIAQLAVLAPAAPGASSDRGSWEVLTAEGVHVADGTLDAAIAHAEREGLDVLDLLPGDLPVDRALETIRLVDPAKFRSDPLALGRGALQATIVRSDVLERAQLDPAALRGMDQVLYVQTFTTLKRHAPRTTAHAVAPSLSAGPERIEQRPAFLRAAYGGFAPAAPAIAAGQLTSLVVGVKRNRKWGLAAVGAYSVQPQVVFAGSAISPRDLQAKTAFRLVDDLKRLVRSTTSRWRSPHEIDRYAGLRPVYDELLADGLDRFFEPRRDTCPWCGSTSITELLKVGDRMQHKPGEFELDECTSCTHIFQNPRLSIDGLNFYYRDFYDGLGEEQMEVIFGGSSTPYVGRAEMAKAHLEPKRWLDVGAGHGHFCLMAKEYLPDTVFDGLDMSESIEEAERRGWIDQGYRGMFPELAPELEGQYDVVSMHHYLEHTREPYEELDAISRVLVPGGHVLIELPNPECRWGRTFKSFWLPWFQPQHQHLIPIGNLEKALEDRGFEIVAEDRGEAEQAVEFLAATFFLVDGAAPVTKLPWLPETGLKGQIRRGVIFTLAMPLVPVAVAIDNILHLFMKRTAGGNGYRVLARKAA